MFLLMVGVALVRKPGCVTAMVFVNFLLSQLLFGSGHGALDWTDGLTQAIFCDLYIVARRGGVFKSGASVMVDGRGRVRHRRPARWPERLPDRLVVRSLPQRDRITPGCQMWNDTWSNGLVQRRSRQPSARPSRTASPSPWCRPWAPAGPGAQPQIRSPNRTLARPARRSRRLIRRRGRDGRRRKENCHEHEAGHDHLRRRDGPAAGLMACADCSSPTITQTIRTASSATGTSSCPTARSSSSPAGSCSWPPW